MIRRQVLATEKGMTTAAAHPACPGAGGLTTSAVTRDFDDVDDGPRPPGWPILPWPAVPASLSLGFAIAPAPGIATRSGSGQSTRDCAILSPPVRGMLDLTVPFTALAGFSAEPGRLSRLGPVSAPEARNLAALAAPDPAVHWRIILTRASGQAIGVARVPRVRARIRACASVGGCPGTATGQGTAPAHAGLVSHVTITIPECILSPSSPDQLDDMGGGGSPDGNLAAVLDAALRAAAATAALAARNRAADAEAGGCAHLLAALGYRPPPGLREYITARDLTCRFPTCRQPAWRGDLDHTIAWEKGGRTCSCNLGGLCRFHHRLKQHLGWALTQSTPGIFQWATPTGRTYSATPDIHP